jgi:hypothetical protein
MGRKIMQMMSFKFRDKDENDLKEWALNYVKAYRDEIEYSETERVSPFLVIKREPDFWWELPDALREVAENTGIENCTVAGPYCVDTDWLPESWGHECYVYQNYEAGEVNSGVEFAEGEFIETVALRLNEFLGHVKSDSSPNARSAVNDLSPLQFAQLITYLTHKVGESLDITKNNFERCPFILSPAFDNIMENIMDDEGIEDSEKIAERMVESIDDFIFGLENYGGDDIFCFLFIE